MNEGLFIGCRPGPAAFQRASRSTLRLRRDRLTTPEQSHTMRNQRKVFRIKVYTTICLFGCSTLGYNVNSTIFTLNYVHIVHSLIWQTYVTYSGLSCYDWISSHTSYLIILSSHNKIIWDKRWEPKYNTIKTFAFNFIFSLHFLVP